VDCVACVVSLRAEESSKTSRHIPAIVGLGKMFNLAKWRTQTKIKQVLYKGASIGHRAGEDQQCAADEERVGEVVH
jgi:hypothetical protein